MPCLLPPSPSCTDGAFSPCNPLHFSLNSLKKLPWLFSNAVEVPWIPTRRGNYSLRAIVFKPPHKPQAGTLRPIHLDIHGGAFIGGLPENDAPFCERLSRETGAVVVSPQYRCSPRHVFPAAYEDIEDVLSWLVMTVMTAEKQWGADPTTLTVSGSSAGTNLALAASQMYDGVFKWPSQYAVQGFVTFLCAGWYTFSFLNSLRRPRSCSSLSANTMFYVGGPQAHAWSKAHTYQLSQARSPLLSSASL